MHNAMKIKATKLNNTATECCNGDCNQGRTCPIRLGAYKAVKTAEAQHVAESGGCGACGNACAGREDGCRHLQENPSAVDMHHTEAAQGDA